MSATIEEYRRAIEAFRVDLERIGDDLESLYLYGSVARGDIVPGRSDLGDAYVFLRQQAIDDRESFLAAFDRMVEACRNLARWGIPSHGFHYFGVEETHYLHAAFLPVLRSPNESRRISGEDLGARTAEPVPVENGMLDPFLFWLVPMARLLALDEPTREECRGFADWMDGIRKFFPPWACAAAGAPSAGGEALRALARLFPEVDLSPFDDLAALRTRGGEPPAADEIKALLERCFTMTEEIHRTILATPREW
jgi:hypothetical protein